MAQRVPAHHILLIGIDEYPRLPLSGCINDLDLMEALFLQRLKVPTSRIQRLAAPRAGAETAGRVPSMLPTLQNLRAAFHRLAGEAVLPGDSVFIYYSGHGTQVSAGREGRSILHEALVPCDYEDEQSGQLLFDYELNGLLERIAERSGDLTVMLDCCHAGSATREDILPHQMDRRTRFLPFPRAIRFALDTAPPHLGTRGLFPTVRRAADYAVLAACGPGEMARELTTGSRIHGALTWAFWEILENAADGALTSLQWADVLASLIDRVTLRSGRQHPMLIGRLSRRIFGGATGDCDSGFPAHRQGAVYVVEGGELFGMTAGAQLELFGPRPALLPPLGSVEAAQPRIALLEVASAARTRCVAHVLEQRQDEAGALRARLLAPGYGATLRVLIDPWDAVLAAELSTLHGIDVLRPGTEAAEVCLRKNESGSIQVLDAVHGLYGDPSLLPLASLDASLVQQGALPVLIQHLIRYQAPLAVGVRAKDLPNALRLALLDCGLIWPTADIPDEDLKDPQLKEVVADPWGGYRLTEGTRVCLAVDNNSSKLFHLFLFDCTASGRVELLGCDDVPPHGRQVFWNGHRDPYEFGIGDRLLDRSPAEAIDRLIVIGTTQPGIDLRALEVKESLLEVLKPQQLGSRRKQQVARNLRKEPLPIANWCSYVVPVRIVRQVEGAR